MTAAGRLEVPPAPTTVGHVIRRTDRYSRQDIEAFAAACRDSNPLHSVGARSRFGEVIASGEHTSSMLIGLATSYFAHGPDGRLAGEVLTLHVNFAFRGPVLANDEVQLHWQVTELTWNAKLGGHVVMLNGGASTERAKPALGARATLLVEQSLVA